VVFLNKFFFTGALLFLCVFLGGASAVSISAANPIPQGTQWSFSADLGSLGNNEAKIFLNNELIVTVLEYSGEKIVPKLSVSQKVLTYSLNGNFVFISCSAMGAGVYPIDVRVYLGDTLVDEISQSIEFVAPLSSKEKEDLRNEINSLNETIFFLQNQLALKDNDINSLESKNTGLQISLVALQARLASLESNFSENSEVNSQELSNLKSDLNAFVQKQEIQNAQNSSPLTGLFSLGEAGANLALVGLAAIILLVFVVLVFKYFQSRNSVYSKKNLPSIIPKPAASLGRMPVEEKKELDDKLSSKSVQKEGKWSFKT
jgi:regulator of replication initiation timing